MEAAALLCWYPDDERVRCHCILGIPVCDRGNILPTDVPAVSIRASSGRLPKAQIVATDIAVPLDPDRPSCFPNSACITDP